MIMKYSKYTVTVTYMIVLDILYEYSIFYMDVCIMYLSVLSCLLLQLPPNSARQEWTGQG